MDLEEILKAGTHIEVHFGQEVCFEKGSKGREDTTEASDPESDSELKASTGEDVGEHL